MMGRKALLLAASALLMGVLLTEGLQATAKEPEPARPGAADRQRRQTISAVDSEDELVPVATAVIPTATIPDEEEPLPAPSMDLGRVAWTVDAQQSLDALSTKWGLRPSTLVALNPALEDRTEVHAGETLLVYRADPAAPTQSIGAPNRGRLAHGIPLPEGNAWMMRPVRRRAFGTETTIASLVQAFSRFADEYPGTPPIRIGEISGPRGGRAYPHKSHRTGRDVDIGYVLHDPPSHGWRRATPRDFDAERNWALIRALVDTGNVQQIYVSAGLQKLLKAHAAKELDREALATYFWDSAAGPNQRPILKHQNGHRDHMHVRFTCEPDNQRCRSKSIARKQKRKSQA